MKFLFICHETSRTGAPMVLLHFMRWLKRQQSQIEVSLLTLKADVLQNEFRETCTHFYDYELLLKPERLGIVQRLLVKLGLKKVRNKRTLLLKQLEAEQFDLIYSNTIKSIPLGALLKNAIPKAKHIVHIHELNVLIEQLLPNIKEFREAIDHVIVPSDLVKSHVISRWGFSKAKMSRVYECTEVDLSTVLPKTDNEVLHIGGSGTVHWRKGYDVFIQVARYLKKHYPEQHVKFTWVGKLYEHEQAIIKEDLIKLDLDDIVKFVGEIEFPMTVYNTFDLFLMCSREDPFPLVCIEVGMLGKPIICFEGATGSSEIIAHGGGFMVPYLDIEAMATKIMHYTSHPEDLGLHGDINKREFSKFTPERICPELFSIINDQIK